MGLNLHSLLVNPALTLC